MWYLFIALIMMQLVVSGAEQEISLEFDIELLKALPVEIQNHIRFFIDGVRQETDEQFKERMRTHKQVGFIPSDALTISMPYNQAYTMILNKEGLSLRTDKGQVIPLDVMKKDTVFRDAFLTKGIVLNKLASYQYPLIAAFSVNNNHIAWLTGVTDLSNVYQKPVYVRTYNCATNTHSASFDCSVVMKHEHDFFIIEKKPCDITTYINQGMQLISKSKRPYVVLYNPIRRIAINDNGRFVALVTNRTCYVIDMKHNLYKTYLLHEPLGEKQFDFNGIRSTFCADEHLYTKISMAQVPQSAIYGKNRMHLTGNFVTLKPGENLLARWFHFNRICKNWQKK